MPPPMPPPNPQPPSLPPLPLVHKDIPDQNTYEENAYGLFSKLDDSDADVREAVLLPPSPPPPSRPPPSPPPMFSQLGDSDADVRDATSAERATATATVSAAATTPFLIPSPSLPSPTPAIVVIMFLSLNVIMCSLWSLWRRKRKEKRPNYEPLPLVDTAGSGVLVVGRRLGPGGQGDVGASRQCY